MECRCLTLLLQLAYQVQFFKLPALQGLLKIIDRLAPLERRRWKRRRFQHLCPRWRRRCQRDSTVQPHVKNKTVIFSRGKRVVHASLPSVDPRSSPGCSRRRICHHAALYHDFECHYGLAGKALRVKKKLVGQPVHERLQLGNMNIENMSEVACMRVAVEMPFASTLGAAAGATERLRGCTVARKIALLALSVFAQLGVGRR